MKYIMFSALLGLYMVQYILCGKISCILSVLQQHRGHLLHLVGHLESECGLCLNGPPGLQEFEDLAAVMVTFKGNTFVKPANEPCPGTGNINFNLC